MFIFFRVLVQSGGKFVALVSNDAFLRGEFSPGIPISVSRLKVNCYGISRVLGLRCYITLFTLKLDCFRMNYICSLTVTSVKYFKFSVLMIVLRSRCLFFSFF